MARNLRSKSKNGSGSFGEALTEQTRLESRMSNRSGLIREVYRDLANLEAERKKIGRQIAELKQKRVKGDLGMKIVNFNMGYRVYQIEHEDRDELFDTLRECFNALGVGEQLDFVRSMEEESAKKTDDPGA